MIYSDIDKVNNLRLYLRHSYYNMAGSQVQDLFAHDKNFIAGAVFNPVELSVGLKLKKHQGYDYSSYGLYDYVDGVLLALFNNNSIDRLIFSDSSLSQQIKTEYINLHSLFTNQRSLLRYMYTVVTPMQTDALIYL